MKNLNKFKLVIAAYSVCFFISCEKDDLIEEKEAQTTTETVKESLDPNTMVSYNGKQMKYSEFKAISERKIASFNKTNVSTGKAVAPAPVVVSSNWMPLRGDLLKNTLGLNERDIRSFGWDAGKDVTVPASTISQLQLDPTQVAFDVDNPNKFSRDGRFYRSYWELPGTGPAPKAEIQLSGSSRSILTEPLFLNNPLGLTSEKIANPGNITKVVAENQLWKTISRTTQGTFTVGGSISYSAEVKVGIPSNEFTQRLEIGLQSSYSNSFGTTLAETLSRPETRIPVGEYAIFIPKVQYRRLATTYNLPPKLKGYISVFTNDHKFTHPIRLDNNAKAHARLQRGSKTIAIDQDVEKVYYCRIEFYRISDNFLMNTIN